MGGHYLTVQPLQQACDGGVSVQSVFSPGADAVLVPLMQSATQSIHAELYQFSYPDLREALADAARRGVDVKVILDPTVNSNLDTAAFLKSRGVQVRWSSPEFTYTHAKSAVIDGRKVAVGSINWSGNAMRNNREAEVVVESARTAAEFEAVFAGDWLKASEVK
jgi:phosphatidylserine/phosphatidylglycerophosphate/cardiolipin synthase-like enzyme